jgi:hypothetical protein
MFTQQKEINMLQVNSTHSNPQVMQHLQDCVRNCLDCGSICQQCAAECISMDKSGMGLCITSCLDCAAVCTLDAELMSRESAYHFKTCELCADICEDCAQICEANARLNDNEIMRECAEACRRCAESCRSMASMAGIQGIH